MRYWCFLIAVSAIAVDVHADSAPALRPLDAWASESLQRATRRSAIVRALAGTIESQQMVVHIETTDVMPANLGGMTRFVGNSGGYRYVRVTLLRRLSPYERATMLGHELQHVVEIAVSAVNTTADMRQLYQGRSETRAAKMMERRVAIELRQRRAWSAEQ